MYQKVNLTIPGHDSLHSPPSRTGLPCPRWPPCRVPSVGRLARRCCWLEPTWARPGVMERSWPPDWRVRTSTEDRSSSAAPPGGPDCSQPVPTRLPSGVGQWRNSLAWRERESPPSSHHWAGWLHLPPLSPARPPPPRTVPPRPRSPRPPLSPPPPGWSSPPWRNSPPAGRPSRMPRRSRCPPAVPAAPAGRRRGSCWRRSSTAPSVRAEEEPGLVGAVWRSLCQVSLTFSHLQSVKLSRNISFPNSKIPYLYFRMSKPSWYCRAASEEELQSSPECQWWQSEPGETDQCQPGPGSENQTLHHHQHWEQGPEGRGETSPHHHHQLGITQHWHRYSHSHSHSHYDASNQPS